VDPRAVVRLGWIKSVKNSNDTVCVSTVIVFPSIFVGLCISAPPTQEKQFEAVLATDTSGRDGCTRIVAVRHQHITAMRDYAHLSFEELRLQYSKYSGSSKQTGCYMLLH
jgi:hypothetical protein